jgi:hypothetical protein
MQVEWRTTWDSESNFSPSFVNLSILCLPRQIYFVRNLDRDICSFIPTDSPKTNPRDHPAMVGGPQHLHSSHLNKYSINLKSLKS